jgi:hypothetical protein
MLLGTPVIILIVLAFCTMHQVSGFLSYSKIMNTRGHIALSSPLYSDQQSSRGDKIRESTGIRPSLHPTTINALSETLRRRSADGEGSKLRVSDKVKPLDVAIETGKIVAELLLKRRDASEHDGMTFDLKEEQTIAGRVVGVVMRLDELGSLLHDRISQVGWVQKYNEWSSFGLLEDESQIEARIGSDPLFALCRSECLLALFLGTVEAPKLMEIGETVPDGSRIDFVDADRLEALLGDFQ